MAKVMTSVPDELLSRIDERARRDHTTRSGLLQRLVERHRSDERAAEDRLVEHLPGEPGHFGGDAADAVRELRRAR